MADAFVSSNGIQPIGMFAVMRHRSDMKMCKFGALHRSRESALAEAQRLAAEVYAQHGPADFCFYVLEVVDRVGIVDGQFAGAV